MNQIKSDKLKILLIFGLFFLIVLLLHADMIYISDDLVLLTTDSTVELSFRELVSRYFYEKTGKIFTDVLGNLLLRVPFVLWKIIDSAVYAAIAYLLVFIFAEVTPLYSAVTCILLLTYPKYYLQSAGYIMTTTNYIYPVFCLLLVLLPIKLASRKEKNTVFSLTIAVLAAALPVAYATDQDQCAMALIGTLLMYLLFINCSAKGKTQYDSLSISENGRNAVFRLTFILLVISVASYVLQFLIPAHLNRAFSGYIGRFSIPDFNDWSVARKIYHGYSTTAANVIFQRCNIYLIMVFFIFILGMLSNSKVKKTAAAVPLAVSLAIKNLGYSKFIYYYPYCCEVPDLRSLSEVKGIITLAISFVAIASVVTALVVLPKSRKTSWFCISALIVGGGSHVMMGFSSTLYGSSFRTLTIMLYSLIVISLLLFKEIEQYKNRTATAACISAMMLSFLF